MFMCRNISAILVLLFSLLAVFNTHAYYGEECDDLSDQEIRDRGLEAMCDIADFWEGLLEEVIVTLDYTPINYNGYTGGYTLPALDFGDLGSSFNWGVLQAEVNAEETKKKEQCLVQATAVETQCIGTYSSYGAGLCTSTAGLFGGFLGGLYRFAGLAGIGVGAGSFAPCQTLNDNAFQWCKTQADALRKDC